MAPRNSYSTPKHHARIWNAARKKQRPTVMDVIREMHKLGNAGWFDANPKLDPRFKGIGFRKEDLKIPEHEIAHLVMEAGHTPSHEILTTAFDRGFSDAWQPNDIKADFIKTLPELLPPILASYYLPEFAESETSRFIPQKHQLAVAYATGLYMRLKLDNYLSTGLHKAPYEQAEAFFKNYSRSDSMYVSPETPQVASEQLWELYEIMPANFLELSRKERRAITAVAMGICDAQSTPYPNRLYPIGVMLKEAGVSYQFQDQEAVQKHTTALKAERLTDKMLMKNPPHEKGPLNGWSGQHRADRLKARNKKITPDSPCFTR